MKRVVVLLVGILSSILISTSAQSATIAEYWEIPKPTEPNQVGVFFDDRADYFYVGALRGIVKKNGYWSGPLCSSLDDVSCSGASYFAFKAMLTPCLTSSDINCIEALEAITPDGKTHLATFSRYATQKEALYWKGDSAKGLPDSKAETIWRFADQAINSDVMVSGIMDGVYVPGQSAKIDRLIATVQPVTEIADASISRPIAQPNDRLDFMSDTYVEKHLGFTGAQQGLLQKNCAATADGICFKREPFPADVKVRLSVRHSQPISGWLHGRMKDSSVDISQNSNYWVTKVEGAPVEVPVVALWSKRSELPMNILDLYKSKAGTTYGGAVEGSISYQTNGQFNQSTLSLFNLWIPLIKDTANATPKMWAFATLDPTTLSSSAAGLQNASKCVTEEKGLAGLVTTNATMYVGAMPTFEKTEGSLNYQVSAPHYSENGKEFLGTYDLVMKSSVARCIYGYTAAPIKATIEVLSSENGAKVATTVQNESNGWFRLGAYGFSFSQPTIRVKLIQDVAPISTPEPTLTPTPTKAPVIKKLITCTKGKTKKVVTSANPKCPTGYKKVA